MIVDITKLTEKFPVEFNMTHTIGLKGSNLQSPNIDLTLIGIVCKNGEFFVCKAQANTDLCFLCDFCLTPIQRNINFSIEERFKKTTDRPTQGEDEGITHLDSNQIDLHQTCMTNLYKHIPMQVLCSPTCKGLCFGCGSNLNNHPCNCTKEQETTDPRFDVLKKLKF
ncbi:MAG: DUF177 domain-containing protein [Defluviitaleaceae bacterium]|nr:DUF177 domain-containing protein [Defluviitaleaceae bacterium]